MREIVDEHRVRGSKFVFQAVGLKKRSQGRNLAVTVLCVPNSAGSEQGKRNDARDHRQALLLNQILSGNYIDTFLVTNFATQHVLY